MPRASLTKTFCERTNYKPGVTTTYFDDRTTGLALRTSPPSRHHKHGLKVWRFEYRYGGRPLVITIGRWPAWSSEEAHAFANKARVCLDNNQDPAAVLRPATEIATQAAPVPADTVSAMFRRYAASRLSELSDAHRINVASFFRRYAIPAWGERGVGTLQRREIVDLLNDIKNAGNPISANRAAGHISAFFSWLIEQGILTADSPAVRLPKSKETPRSRVLSLDELALIWRAADQLRGPVGRFVQLLAVTLTRRDEAAGLLRTEIDGDAWLLPAARNKPKRDFLITLPPLAREVLDKCPDTGPYFFSMTGRRPLSGFARAKAAIDAAIIKLQGPGQPPLPHWTFHDFRRSVSHLAELKIDDTVIERLLNHKMAKLAGTYNCYDYREPKAEALQKWNDCLASHITNLEMRAAAD